MKHAAKKLHLCWGTLLMSSQCRTFQSSPWSDQSCCIGTCCPGAKCLCPFSRTNSLLRLNFCPWKGHQHLGSHRLLSAALFQIAWTGTFFFRLSLPWLSSQRYDRVQSLLGMGTLACVGERLSKVSVEGKSEDITRHQKISHDIRRYQKTSEDITRHQKTSQDIRRYHKTSEDIRRHQKTLQDILTPRSPKPPSQPSPPDLRLQTPTSNPVPPIPPDPHLQPLTSRPPPPNLLPQTSSHPLPPDHLPQTSPTTLFNII
jgi:hypothetical protein